MALYTGAASSTNKFLGNLSSDPTGAEGDLYYNTSTDLYRFYDGSAWKNVSDQQKEHKLIQEIVQKKYMLNWKRVGLFTNGIQLKKSQQ